MSAKDNFAQAMKELLNGEGEASTQKEEKKPAPSSFSSFSQPEAKPQRAEVSEAEGTATVQAAVMVEEKEDVFAENEFAAMDAEAEAIDTTPVVPTPAPAPEYRASSFIPPQTTYAPPAAPKPSPSPMVAQASAPIPSATAETTVVAPGTTIVGDITTAGGLRIGGNVKGNLKVASMMELNGKVIGDVEAADAVIIGSTVRGNVIVSNVLTMDGDTTIIGDVAAKNVDINGKIKGNLTVEERGHFQQDAVLVGNLMSGTVIIDEGAMLKGDISITSAQTENVTVEEPDFDIN